MKRLILIVLLLAGLSAQAHAQPVKKTFTGTLECMSHIPTYQEGKVFYVNPYAGGQSGNMVILSEGNGNYRIWDNASQTWFSESLEGCKSLFFINPDILFVALGSERCGLFYTEYLESWAVDDKALLFTDWRFKLNNQKQIEYLPLALGEKWGVMAPNCHFLVPTKYDSPEKALAAIAQRKADEKPQGMSDIDYIISKIKEDAKADGEMGFGYLHEDWEWYDPVSGTLFFTLQELPWSGPSYRFSGIYDYQPESDDDGIPVIYDVALGVKDGVLTWATDWDSFQGKLLPLSHITNYLLAKPVPVHDGNGDVFIGRVDEYNNFFGWLLHPDGSFQIGHFSGYMFKDEAYIKYRCAPGEWEFDDFRLHYALSEHNKGRTNLTNEEILEAYRKNIATSSYEYWFYPTTYDDAAGTLRIEFQPGYCYVDVPMSKAKAKKFKAERENLDSGDYAIRFDRIVDDEGKVHIDNLWIRSYSGIEIEYKAQ
ncbi:MAG: hypothetical protein IK052_04060 [Bacteroidales bacterium]|nr:hypothetical protein [Bacteroidales bacterium]